MSIPIDIYLNYGKISVATRFSRKAKAAWQMR
jgi:hypothetical protein